MYLCKFKNKVGTSVSTIFNYHIYILHFISNRYKMNNT